jgi:predicted  nucleic acid-binding Zn-ribbon protein
MDVRLLRADRQAAKDETQVLRERIARLERELSRARRCIAELRRSKDARMSEARDDQNRSDAAIKMLAKLSFPEDCKAVKP